MASSRDRQRKLARAKFDRQLARRAEKERRRRRISAGVGAGLAVLLIVAGVAWIGGAFDSDESTETAAGDTCLWTPQSVTSNPDLKEVGTPPTKDLPEDGTETLTISTNQGAPIVADLDVASAPCAAASMSHLAGKAFFDNTDCHEITADGALRCGDPSGTGNGGPAYSFYDENVPDAPEPAPSASAAANKTVLYPKGTVALIGNPPSSNGSQFLIFLKDFAPAAQPLYPIIGRVSGGLDTLDKIGKITTVENATGDKVKPKDKITIKSLSIGPAPAPSAAPSASAQS
ncbi:peptidylprolyl isomerase [Actinoplanes sp. GCM10030250]|uniref:peptidylprolyl isomerase n=1 Tax=Actinoplanes sp. GCM10030250 TaxID=3273376 RepID=UPI00361F2361